MDCLLLTADGRSSNEGGKEGWRKEKGGEVKGAVDQEAIIHPC